jgi:hypothetical protein
MRTIILGVIFVAMGASVATLVVDRGNLNAGLFFLGGAVLLGFWFHGECLLRQHIKE